MLESLKRAYSSELLFYRSHHQNKINWYIHRVCIPLEWLSWFIFTPYIQLTIAIALIVAVYYLLTGSKASCTAAFATIMLGYIALILNRLMIRDNACFIAFSLQIIAWLAQVRIGHFYFEKNSPGMLKKITVNGAVLSLLMVFEQCGVQEDYSLGPL